MSSGIRRAFFDISEKDVDDTEMTVLLQHSLFGKTSGWDDILKSRRILLIAEAQSGKTYECQARQRELWQAGEPAFYIELSSVASQPWRELRCKDETERLEKWRRTETDIATIFLDSLDELNLTQGKFQSALRNVANDLHGHTGRVRVVLTSRPLPVDRALFLKTFDAPRRHVPATENDFARIALGEARAEKKEKKEEPLDVRYVSLLPLRADDVATLASARGVDDAAAFQSALNASSMMEFMRRPQDVIEAVSAWKELRGGFGRHAEQVAFDIRARLKPNPDREDRQLEDVRALDGAKRLALAVVLSRRLTIRHDVNNDPGDASTVVEPAVILPEWRADDRKALLERGLFGFASYGRVRFHNRLAFEFLAAQRLADLIDNGMSRKAVRRLLAVRTVQGWEVIRPSMQAVSAWLALRQPWVFDLANDLDPAILMNLGDPGSLPVERRQRVLTTYIERFGKGGWRGLSVPQIQIHRLADSSLGPIVRGQFDKIENPEVRRVLLNVIGHSRLYDCADIARRVVWDSRFDEQERIWALDALIALNDADLVKIAKELCNATDRWDHRFARSSIGRLFPQHMSVDELIAALGWVPETRDLGSALSRLLPEQIEGLPVDQIEKLRAGLTPLVDLGLTYDANKDRTRNKYPHLVNLLAATCTLLLQAQALAPTNADSVALAAELIERSDSIDKIPSAFFQVMTSASPAIRAAVFEERIVLQRGLRPDIPRLNLFTGLVWRNDFRPQPDDTGWIRQLIADPQKSADLRAALLFVEIFVFVPQSTDRQAHLFALKSLVADDKELADYLETHLKPPVFSPDMECWRAKNEQIERESALSRSQARASWIKFRQDLIDDPDAAFSPERAEHTTYNLWRFMVRGSTGSRSSGWNRRLMEEHLGKPIADRFRKELIPIWRKETPPLTSERPETERGSHFCRWDIALVAIDAEAEDPEWANRLSPHEAEIAVRYAEKNWSNFPAWLDALSVVHAEAVERVLGQEISAILSSRTTDANWHSIILQNVHYASPEVAQLFLPRLRAWLQSAGGTPVMADDNGGAAKKLEQVIEILLKFGAEVDRRTVGEIAVATLDRGTDEAFTHVLLPALFATDPEKAVARLEAICSDVEASQRSVSADWFARLFGRFYRGEGVDLRRPAMTSRLLLRLLRLAYQHVNPSGDTTHEGSYTPNMRDHAEQGRNSVLSAVLELVGPEGWNAKLEIANKPEFRHLRERVLALAVEKSAQEADNPPMRPDDVAKLGDRQESGPRSSAEMFALVTDRLEDLRDDLLSDISPRELWSLITDERLMRRAIAGELVGRACGAYTVAQESVTAEEKETDIRLRSSANDVEGVIELKIGDKGYSAADLRQTISEQLVHKYLAPSNRRAGCLLITRSKRPGWQHPDTGKRIDFAGLIDMLREAAKDLQSRLPGEIQIDVFGLDLKPRLSTERGAVAAKRFISRRALKVT